MPIEELALPRLFEIVQAHLLEKDLPEDVPEGVGPHGLTDAQLWEAIRLSDADMDTVIRPETQEILAKAIGVLPFDVAVNTDPRRIDALIQMRIINDFYLVLEVLKGSRTDQAVRYVFLHSYHQLRRADGAVTAHGLANVSEQMWGYYSQVLEAGLRMRREGTPAAALWELIVENRGLLFQDFRECIEIAQRAARAAISDEDKAAWGRIAAVTRDMWETLNQAIIGLGEPDDEWYTIQPVPGGDEQYGAIYQWHSGFAQYQPSGHRAPGQDVEQWRRAGGRFYS